MRPISWLVCGIATTLSVLGCQTFSDTMVGGGGTGTTTTSSETTSGSTTTSGAIPCTDYKQCTANATDCQQPTCKNGFCGVEYSPAGTPATQQTQGDCQKVVCDGNGNTSSQADDTDVPDDANDCTVDECKTGVPSHTPKAAGAQCSQNGGTLCTAAGVCVECLSSSDCTSGVCTSNKCAGDSCTDGVQNGNESDVDCGGAACPGCAAGKKCSVNTDCASASCTAGVCDATCTDGAKNGAETDIDCGGPTCPKCASGQACAIDGDCNTGRCTNSKCADVLVISQVQTRGDAGGNDEFVELYNPTSVPVTFDASWTLKARSAIVATGGSCTTLSLATRFTGSGQVIPPHKHILFANATVPPYNGSVAADGTYTIGVPDAASVVLLHGNDIVDALCFYYDQATHDTLTTCSAAYTCEGTAALNPHNNTTGASSNVDASLERLPGGSGGNLQDTGDSSADFATNATPDPHNLASAAVP